MIKNKKILNTFGYIFTVLIISSILIYVGIYVYMMQSPVETFDTVSNLNIIDNINMTPNTLPINKTDFNSYVINLTRNKDRLVDFQNSYNQSDLSNAPLIRINAVDGKQIQYKDYVHDTPEMDLTPGMVGCYLSHIDAYTKIQNSGKAYGLVFEDDARMDPTIYKNTIAQLHETMPTDWDIILLGYMVYDPVHRYEVHDSYLKMLKFWGTHGYLINQNAVAKVLELMKPPFKNQIDHVMSEYSKDNTLKIYGVKSAVVRQFSSHSDVQKPK